MALFLFYCFAYLSPSVLSIFLSSTSPEEVIHRSAIRAVFSLSPASSPSVTWLKTDVGVINRRQRKPAEPPQYHGSSSLWCLVLQHRVTDNFSLSCIIELSFSVHSSRKIEKNLRATSSWANIASVFCCAFISVLSQSSFLSLMGMEDLACTASHTYTQAHNDFHSVPLSAAGAVETHGRGSRISISKKGWECVREYECAFVCVGAPRCSLNQYLWI